MIFAKEPATKTAVSGSKSSSVTSRAPGDDAFLWGLTFDEKGDKPCYIKAHWWRFHTKGERDDFETVFDICSGNAKGDRSAIFHSKDVSLPAVDSVTICQASDKNPRLKGATLTAAAIDRNSSDKVEGGFMSRTFERTNCSSWAKKQSCPSGAVATGIDIHHDDKEITGLALACTKPQIGSSSYDPPPPLTGDALYDRFAKDIRVQVDENGRTETMSLAEARRRHEVNAVSIIILKEGRIDQSRHYGVKSKKTEAKVNEDTMYDAASMAKLPAAIAMLAAARTEAGPKLLRTVENSGKEFPNSTLGKWVDKQFKGKVESGFPADITVERLISHSAGLDTHSVGSASTDNPTRVDTILLGGTGNPGVKPQAAPGTVWDYSGGGFTVAEAMLEAHTGSSAKSFLDRNILDAFGLKRSSYADASENMKNLAGGCSKEPCDEKPEYTKAKFAGGLLANPEDYARLLLILMNKGRDIDDASKQLIPEEDVRRLLTPISHRDSSRRACKAHTDCRANESCYGSKCIRPLDAWGDWYGLGVFLVPGSDYEGLPRYFQHGGAHDESRSRFEVDRQTKNGILIFVAGKDSWKKSGVEYGADHIVDDILDAWKRNYK